MRKRWKILLKIVRKTGLLHIYVAFAPFVLVAAWLLRVIEPTFKTFGESLWFCFISFTTVGYGEMVPETGLGKIITVILVMYGILVMAVTTSVWVNYYRELDSD